MVAVVALVAVESLARVLLALGRAWGVLRWRGLVCVVLVAKAAEPSAVVVLRLLAIVVGWSTALRHPPGAIHGLHSAAAATTVADARPGDEEQDEEDNDDGGKDPAAVVVPPRGLAVAKVIQVLTGGTGATTEAEWGMESACEPRLASGVLRLGWELTERMERWGGTHLCLDLSPPSTVPCGMIIVMIDLKAPR